MEQPEVIVVKVSDVHPRDDLYPRLEIDSATVQKYAENVDALPPIEINQHGDLIDGAHRLKAHRTVNRETICAFVTQTESDVQLYALAIERNASHGLQMNNADKEKCALRLFNVGEGLDKEQIAKLLSVSVRTVNSYLGETEQKLREQRNAEIKKMWLQCYTQDEIAEAVGISQPAVVDQIKVLSDLETFPKLIKLSADFADADFVPPLYNVWTFAKKTNKVSHFGNSEQQIVDNLLYLYTQPFDIVVDPFAGGGSTLDVCDKRLRRCWIADRKPIVARETEIRQHDVVAADGSIVVPPLNKRWSEVTLTYLDPPYWRQAAGQYSDDPEDFGNMPLDQFTVTLAKLIDAIASKQTHGAIALLMQPTQWSADNRQYTDHVFDVIQAVTGERLILENRVSVPYSTQQYNPQQVEWAKENRKLLVLTRELVIWKLRE